MNPLRLAIDLDGVLHNPEDVAPGYKMGRPIPGAVDAMNKAMSEWLRWANIPYDFITNVKPDVDYYLDDKNIRFTTWDEALLEIKRRTPQS
jgi:hypothetical protein